MAKTKTSNLAFQYHSPPIKDPSSSDWATDWRHITVHWKGLPFLRVIKTDFKDRDGSTDVGSLFIIQSEMKPLHLVATGLLTHSDVEAKCKEFEQELKEFAYKIQTRKAT